MKELNTVEGLVDTLIKKHEFFTYENMTLPEWYNQVRVDGHKYVSEDLLSLYGGFFSNDVSQAFINGYEVAIQRLMKWNTQEHLAAFCVTENKSSHPRAMLSCLSQGVDGNFVLSGRKDFVTLAGEADTLFVAVTEGESQGRSNIKMVMVKVSTPGVDVVLHPPLSFVPNVSHGSVTFDSVVVNAGDIFSGDGYSEYVKPFRWFEDINVFTSVAAYLFKLTLAYDWKVEARVEIISILISLSYLQKIDAGDSIAHIVMSDLVKRLERWLECYDKEWEKVPEAVSNEWSRDKLLLKIASSARKVRHGNAIDKLLLNNVA